MAANSNRGRSNGSSRAPSFIVIGMAVVIAILGFNYWSASSKNAALSKDLESVSTLHRRETVENIRTRQRQDAELLSCRNAKGQVEEEKKQRDNVIQEKDTDIEAHKSDIESLKSQLDICDNEKSDGSAKLEECRQDLTSTRDSLQAAKEAQDKGAQECNDRVASKDEECNWKLEALKTDHNTQLQEEQKKLGSSAANDARLKVLLAVHSEWGNSAISILQQRGINTEGVPTDNNNPKPLPSQNGQQQQGNPPEQQGNPPEQQGNPPEQQGNLPEQQGNPPEQQGNPPEQQGNPPEQQGNPPEEQGKPAEQQGNPPEQQGNPPEQGGIDNAPRQINPPDQQQPGEVKPAGEQEGGRAAEEQEDQGEDHNMAVVPPDTDTENKAAEADEVEEEETEKREGEGDDINYVEAKVKKSNSTTTTTAATTTTSKKSSESTATTTTTTTTTTSKKENMTLSQVQHADDAKLEEEEEEEEEPDGDAEEDADEEDEEIRPVRPLPVDQDTDLQFHPQLKRQEVENEEAMIEGNKMGYLQDRMNRGDHNDDIDEDAEEDDADGDADGDADEEEEDEEEEESINEGRLGVRGKVVGGVQLGDEEEEEVGLKGQDGANQGNQYQYEEDEEEEEEVDAKGIQRQNKYAEQDNLQPRVQQQVVDEEEEEEVEEDEEEEEEEDDKGMLVQKLDQLAKAREGYSNDRDEKRFEDTEDQIDVREED